MENQNKFYIDFNTNKIIYKDKSNNEYIINEQKDSDNKLAIIGSRSITDIKFVNKLLDYYKFIFGTPKMIISGGAKGIDSIGETWGDNLNIKKQIFLPDWVKYGKRAGFIRNEDIIKNCDICLAIWDGESHGTKNDLDLCTKYNKPLILFNMKEYNSNEFCGFYFISNESNELEIFSDNKKQNKKIKYQKQNRWLPQSGIISL